MWIESQEEKYDRINGDEKKGKPNGVMSFSLVRDRKLKKGRRLGTLVFIVMMMRSMRMSTINQSNL